ncbi:3-hydroxyisobutyrate dehydrogenase-like beta-hydroxyacid dehydrogenase [Rhizobium sp. BK529]|uniref:NAD(P)-dependent oxidoreductase n=1 Tax=unclassified Rhizobium TaxID=2613769 RepID=UPI00104E4824|nr:MULTISPECIES: NAD(P)-dependent oxidoreductase [unclassified Rhizobium]MBB3595845.1 3-hydroxyisobutyrate dehydrogenase-like beta-hydroxyacid dehydrogenase [Rhizobium sp. BK529]TCR95130.1 3-hydroxyisobutyrate dehydrogenase [Rhizobium sp. BK418]
MKVAVVGTGEMGLAMAGHMLEHGHEVSAFDVDAERLAAAAEKGIMAAGALSELSEAEAYILVVATDQQVIDVCERLAESAMKGSIIAVAATISPETMLELGPKLKEKGIGLVDAPVVYGASGAKSGTLLSLCGGSEEDVERIRPVLMCYSRDVLRVGPLGSGQIAKSCNNLLHWVHCVANYETLLIAKRYGIDAQRMREILLLCPGTNGTLARWDTTRFTWQEKDMDVTLELAQKGGLMLPLAGQVDQIIKSLKADDVKGLLYGPEASYLGKTVRPMSPAEGGVA